jgi:hypothetical protein
VCDKARELLEKMIVGLRPMWGPRDSAVQERELRHYFDQGLELALPVVHLRYKLLQREAAKEEQRCAMARVQSPTRSAGCQSRCP